VVYFIASAVWLMLIQKTAIALCHAKLLVVGKKKLVSAKPLLWKTYCNVTENCSYCGFIASFPYQHWSCKLCFSWSFIEIV